MARNLRTVFRHGIERLVPEAAIDAFDIRRRASHWKRRGVIAIHVPKAAGTSVQTLLYGRPLGHFRARDIARIYPELWDRCQTVAVVRDPLTRLRSAWLFARDGGTKSMGMRRPSLYRVPEFETFERFVTEWLAQRDLTKLDGVFRPQTLYLADAAGTVMVDTLLRFERVSEEVAARPDLFGKGAVLPRINTTAAVPPPPTPPEIEGIVRRLYAQDYALLNYP